MDFGSFATGLILGRENGLFDILGSAFGLGIFIGGGVGVIYWLGRLSGRVKRESQAILAESQRAIPAEATPFEKSVASFEVIGEKITIPAQIAAGAGVGIARGAFRAGQRHHEVPKAPTPKPEQHHDIVEV